MCCLLESGSTEVVLAMRARRQPESVVSVVGRIFDPEGGAPGGVVLVAGGAHGKRVAADALGRFRLDVDPDKRRLKLAIERDGATISEHEIDLAAIEGELVLEVPPRPLAQDGPVAIAIGSDTPPPLKAGVVDGLRDRAAALGIGRQAIRAIEVLLDQLDDLSSLGVRAVSGDRDALESLRGALEREVPFDFGRDLSRFKPGPSDFGIDPCAVLPRSPWAVVAAGLILDGDEGEAWAGRAVSALLRRSEPAVRVARALSGLEAGHVGQEPLLDAVTFADEAASRGRSGAPIWDVLDDAGSAGGLSRGPEIRPRGDLVFPIGGFDPGGFEPDFDLPHRRGIESLLDPCNLEWLECAHTFVAARPPAPSHPPAVGSIEPSDILAGQPAQITLRPPAGGSFGSAQDPAWVIQLGATVLVPASWHTDAIVLDIPALPPGCLELKWVVDTFAAKEFFDQQTAACARFFGERAPFPPFITERIGRVSVVGTPAVKSFTANNVAPKLDAEGCTPVQIAWNVDRLVCQDSTADFDLEVTDDTGAVLYSGAAESGSVSVTTGEDRVYTLRASNTLGGVASPAAVARLDVERFQRVTAITVTPAGLLKPGQHATVEVTLSCPADDAAQVVVSSDHPNRFPGLQLTVPVGQSKASKQVTVGAETGKVTLSAAAAGVAQTPATTTVTVHDPKIDALVSSSVEQCDGGAVTVRVRGAVSVSSVGLNGPSGFVPGTGLQVTASVPSDPASGTLQVVARFGPLAAGTYTVRVQADGVLLDAGQIVVMMRDPSVTIQVSRTQVQICALTAVTVTATATRATQLAITREDGSAAAPPVMQTNPCGTFTATATVQLSDAETFTATATRAGVAPATKQAAVGRTSSVPTASSVTLVNIMDKVAGAEVTVYIYVVSVKADGTASTDRVGQITSPMGSITYTPATCERFELWALRTDDPTEILTSNWKLRTGAILGHPAGSAAIVRISGN
jgi:hypothetical protein